jgi:predicted kinase
MKTTTADANEMVFTMGLPAAGKSTYVAATFASTHTVIDPDLIKETLSNYDPKNPAACHEESAAIAETMFQAALDSGKGRWVVDGTGTNAEKMLRRVRQASRAGFAVRLVYVRCSLESSLRRNAMRARHVPESVIRSKADDISTAFEIVSTGTTNVTIIDT